MRNRVLTRLINPRSESFRVPAFAAFDGHFREPAWMEVAHRARYLGHSTKALSNLIVAHPGMSVAAFKLTMA